MKQSRPVHFNVENMKTTKIQNTNTIIMSLIDIYNRSLTSLGVAKITAVL